eukprot:11272094-Karenia_brevis.AAC.1
MMANDQDVCVRDFGWDWEVDPTILMINSVVHIARRDLLAALTNRWENALSEGDWHLVRGDVQALQ